jgi:sarcosine oxidase subunit alpha
MSGHRLPSGGLIDRARPLSFNFDGRAFQGLSGDTLASALLANGGAWSGARSYHRPRGISRQAPEEPNALVELRTARGASRTRAATT